MFGNRRIAGKICKGYALRADKIVSRVRRVIHERLVAGRVGEGNGVYEVLRPDFEWKIDRVFEGKFG